MTEEQVTKAILSWLIKENWKIICFDFPQSGTGRALHPNTSYNEKNKDSVIPDIVAIKDGRCVFFENKDRFYLPDYKKVNKLITTDDYSQSIERLLSKENVSTIFYGIGLPAKMHREKSKQSTHLVDFIIGVLDDMNIDIVYSKEEIF